MDDQNALRVKWDQIYSDVPDGRQIEPAEVLSANAHLLPMSGTALDLACGLGGNALFLAARGLVVRAWDFSLVAVEKLQAAAGSLGLTLLAEVRDVEARPPEPGQFDVIVVSRFLVRELAGALVDALKPGGLLFYQTFTAQKVSDTGPSNPAYLLRENELLRLFGELGILFYREEGRVGDLSRGFRNQAQLIGRRRP